MANTIEQLEKQIEQLIRDHVAQCRQRAAAALERAFAASRTGPTRSRGKSRSIGRRRPPDELAELGERLYQAVCAQPGSTMMALATLVGSTARELNRPARYLKRAGRVRSVGERSSTRYFPMASKRTVA